jgi:P pilus assembly chaperone PapD
MLRYHLTIHLTITVLFLSLLALITPSFAMSVEPMSFEMTTLGKGARHTFKVSNLNARPLPVETAVLALELGLQGEEKTSQADDKFLIYPAQAMIPPGGSQIFRVQWLGEPEIAKSETYRINISQVPVKRPEDAAGIELVLTFGVTVNVAPPKATGGIVVISAAPVTKDGKRLAALTVKNPGNKHAYLRQAAIRLSGGSWSADLTPGDIAQKVGLGIVQPGKERRFVLPVEVPASVAKIEAAVKLAPDTR